MIGILGLGVGTTLRGQLPYVERERPEGRPYKLYRGSYTPRICDIANHLAFRGESTIWTANPAHADRLVMLGDIDTENGDAEGAARYLSRQYLGNHTYIEPSTGGNGRCPVRS